MKRQLYRIILVAIVALGAMVLTNPAHTSMIVVAGVVLAVLVLCTQVVTAISDYVLATGRIAAHTRKTIGYTAAGLTCCIVLLQSVGQLNVYDAVVLLLIGIVLVCYAGYAYRHILPSDQT